MKAFVEEPYVFMVLKNQSDGNSTEHVEEKSFVLEVKCLDIRGKLWLFLAWFFKIIEHILVENIQSLSCSNLHFVFVML